MKFFLALEPFHQKTEQIKNMFRILGHFSGAPKTTHVGFVVTRSESEINLAFDYPPEERFTVFPKNKIKELLKKSKIHVPDSQIHVTDFPTLSVTKSTKRLHEMAQKQKVEAIALFTKSQKGFARFALGSFAESLIHSSQLPLLIMNPKAQVPKKIKNVFLCLDQSPSWKSDLERAIELCRQMKSKLTVFHAAQVSYRWSMDEENSQVLSYRKKVDSWLEQMSEVCESSKVDIECVLAAEFESPAVLALRQAKTEKADIVIVKAKTGRLAALLGGSVTRRIVREASVPVFVLK
jgi:nucleotide-binding universal stress UspA family protein